ncbi:MAG: hypothetical protein L6R39_001951 [Caloplaca ligustica]|nr:MAG: hypothetical protein L6R39_001951 [Caloplaca ligustica]
MDFQKLHTATFDYRQHKSVRGKKHGYRGLFPIEADIKHLNRLLNIVERPLGPGAPNLAMSTTWQHEMNNLKGKIEGWLGELKDLKATPEYHDWKYGSQGETGYRDATQRNTTTTTLVPWRGMRNARS